MAERMNELTGKEWLQNSFSIWRDLVKDAEEKAREAPCFLSKSPSRKAHANLLER